MLQATHGHEIPISHHPSYRSSWNTLHGKTIHINYTLSKLTTNVHVVIEICSSLIVPQYLEMFNIRYHLWSQYNGQLSKFVEVNICWQLVFLPPTSHWSSLLLTNNKINIAACILNCQKYYKAIFIKGCLTISDQNKHHFNNWLS